jgi:hypothetical protein
MKNFITVILMVAIITATIELYIDGYIPSIMKMQRCNGIASLMKY